LQPETVQTFSCNRLLDPISADAHPVLVAQRADNPDMRYLQSMWVKVGLGLLIIGASPLVLIAAAAVGLWPDPNPNPIGEGLLFFCSCWPALLCIVVGVVRVNLYNRSAN
jgi:hypothetical protein